MKAVARETWLVQVLESGRERSKKNKKQKTKNQKQGRAVQDTGARVSSGEEGERGPPFV